MDAYDPKPCVAVGIARLDATPPNPRLPFNWHLDINPDELDMSDPCDCMFGQIHGDYLLGLKIHGIRGPAEAIRCGFDVPAEPAETKPERYALLRAAWIEAVTERLAAKAA